jgi:hypothetical protein
MGKGHISSKVENILHNDEGRKQLRNSLISGRDCKIVVDGKNYRVSSRNVARSSATGRFVSKKSGGSLKSTSVKSKAK